MYLAYYCSLWCANAWKAIRPPLTSQIVLVEKCRRSRWEIISDWAKSQWWRIHFRLYFWENRRQQQHVPVPLLQHDILLDVLDFVPFKSAPRLWPTSRHFFHQFMGKFHQIIANEKSMKKMKKISVKKIVAMWKWQRVTKRQKERQQQRLRKSNNKGNSTFGEALIFFFVFFIAYPIISHSFWSFMFSNVFGCLLVY